jgi:ABC-type nitrate/sulfonate/bicarbonate transport system permease component
MFAALFVLAAFTLLLHRSVGLLADHLARRAKGMA